MYFNHRMNRCGLSRYVASMFIVLFLLLLTSCGGGGGSGNDPASASQGVLLDSPVVGIRFETATQSGITDANGTFDYATGETVEFFIGDISLGSALGVSTLTPIDLVSGAVDETNEQVTNILRFLQSLDSDMDASNGIQISSTIRTLMMGQALNFAQAMVSFETDFTAISNAMLSGMVLVSITDAQAHMRATLDAMTGGGSGGGSGGGNQGLGSITLSGADTATVGSSFAPTFEGSSTVQTATAVNWGGLSGATLGFSATGNELVTLTYVYSSGAVVGGGISIQLYTYSIICWPVAAAECGKITLDVAGKRLVLNNVQLTPTSLVISTNNATGPITLNGTVYWE